MVPATRCPAFTDIVGRIKRTIILAAALLVSSTLGASAETVTYVFRAFVEHYTDAGATRPANYGGIIFIRVTVNTAVPGTVSGNTETYSGSGANDPIVSTQIGNTTVPQTSNDSLVITKNPDGSSSITIFSYAVQRGAYTIAFASSRGDALKSLAIPSRILSLHFDNSTYSSSYPGATVSGHLVTAGIPPASTSSQP